MKRFGLLAALAAITALALVVVGCGSSGSDSTSSGGAGSTAGSGGSSTVSSQGGGSTEKFIEETEKAVAAAEAKQTTKPPTTGPPIQPAKSVVLIPCGAQFEGCNNPIEAAKEAAEKIGWKVTVINPEGDPTKYSSSIRQAVASGADGIMLGAIDADVASAAIKEAKRAGVAVVVDLGVDPENIVDAVVPEEKIFESGGYAMGGAMYLHNEDSAKIGYVTAREFGIIRAEQKGTEQFIADCEAAGGDCEDVAVENVTSSNVEAEGAQTTINMMRANTSINSVWSNADATTQIIAPPAESAGVTENSILGSFNANAANLNAIAAGSGWQKYDAGASEVWVGYACIDALNRAFAGEPQVDEGVRLKLFSEANAPSSGAWEGDVDVPALYEKLWHVN